MITREPHFVQVPNTAIGRLGRNTLLLWQNVGQAALMTVKAFGYAPQMFNKRCRHEVLYQMWITAIKSLPVLTVVGLFTGMIFAVQTGMELRRFGQQAQVGGAVAVVMFREMGPFMTALIIAASVGSAIAAQLGTMTVSEEIAALEIMSIDPVRFLVMPRLLALTIMMPALTFFVDIMAILGGGIVAATQLDVAPHEFWDKAILYSSNKDLLCGLAKATLFGIVINTVACHQGFTTKSGAVGVGQATRKTVVISFLTILVMGFVITKLFYS